MGTAAKILKAKYEAQDGSISLLEDERVLQPKPQRSPHARPVANKSFKGRNNFSKTLARTTPGERNKYTRSSAKLVCLRRSLGKISALPPASEFTPRDTFIVSGAKDGLTSS
ncbi:hypothetical protein FRC00_002211, partial [Tulasnella sp. 408]